MATETKKAAPKGPQRFNAPAGYAEQTGDITGFWDDSLSPTIHFIPVEVRAFDSQLDKNKPSMLVIGKLVDAIPLSSGKTGKTVEGKPGELVGVWAKPGMRNLKNLAGVRVFMYDSGETLATGKVNPMRVYKVLSKDKGAELLVTDDKRKQSRGAKLFFELGTAALNDHADPNV